MATFFADLKNQLVGGASLVPNDSAAAASYSLDGNTVDLLLGDGPINVIYSVGATTGTPDSFSVTFKLQYSTDNSTWTDYTSAGADSTNPPTAVTTASTDNYMVIWHPPVGSRYWQLLATVTFVNGSSPKVGVAGYIYRNKKVLGGSGTQLSVAIS